MAPSRYMTLEPDDVKNDDSDEIQVDNLTINDAAPNATPPTQPDDSSLIRELRKLARDNPKLVRGKKYTVPGHSIELTSWKMTEWMYTKSPCPFPTLARGLFTRWIPAPGHEHDPEGKAGAGRDQIVVRGYDKFFNMYEVKWNTWESLAIHTAPPYTLTLKSNGCIIFMSALTPTDLVVTSKHSLGEVEGSPISHAQKGEEWLETHLKQAGKTRLEFCKTLFERNLTAIAELCDDSFEEHVLPYPKEMTGLHLHGLNERRVDFSTLDNDQVVAFAREWGFIPTAAITFDTLEKVKEFTDEIGKEGKWRGEAVEGFVVRTNVCDRAPQPVQAYRGTRGDKIPNKTELSTPPPYAPGSTFFFKIKFEEPYLMYREWRELTKKMLVAAEKGALQSLKISPYMLRRPETRAYRHWITEQIRRNRDSLRGFSQGHGIIATRERFLAWCEATEGQHILVEEKNNSSAEVADLKGSHKTIIMPVAIPGSGKTAVALALKYLYGFGHTQSDDVQQKKTGPKFVQNVMELLNTCDTVFADRNNHLRQLRDGLRDEFKAKYGNKGHIIALQWILNHTPKKISDICAERIATRGDNHQSLFADGQESHRAVIGQFFGSFEEVEAEEVDDIVDMDYTDTLEQSVARAISGVSPILELSTPDASKISAACASAKEYKVNQPGKKKSASKPPRYFALIPQTDLEKLVGDKMSSGEAPESGSQLWSHLVAEKRLTKYPHVTLIHTKEKHNSEKLWECCWSLQKSAGEIEPSFSVTFDHIVWNSDMMALSVSEIEMHGEFEKHRNIGQSVIEHISDIVARRLHLTIGTRDDSVNPFQAAAMVAEWRSGSKSDVQSLPLDNCVVEGKFAGRYS